MDVFLCLQDAIRTESYQLFMQRNEEIFKDKVRYPTHTNSVGP